MFLFLLHRKTCGHWANVIKHRWGNSQRCLNLVRKNSSSDVYPISNETPKRKSTQFCVIQFLIRCALFLFFYLTSICMYVLWICCCASFTFSCIIWARVSVCIIICEIKDDVIFARILLSDRFFFCMLFYCVIFFPPRCPSHEIRVPFFRVVLSTFVPYFIIRRPISMKSIRSSIFFPLPKHINTFSDVFFSRCAVVVVSMAVWLICVFVVSKSTMLMLNNPLTTKDCNNWL